MTEVEKMDLLDKTTEEAMKFSYKNMKMLNNQMGMIENDGERMAFNAGRTVERLMKIGWTLEDIDKVLDGSLERFKKKEEQLTS